MLAATKTFGEVPHQFKLRFHVYAARLLFYLIAYEPLRIAMQVKYIQYHRSARPYVCVCVCVCVRARVYIYIFHIADRIANASS